MMTRFLSHLTLTTAEDGTLEPFSEDVPEPIASEPGEACSRRGRALWSWRACAAGCAGSGGSPSAEPPPPPRQPPPPPPPQEPPKAKGPLVYVSVIDGDTHAKVKGAVVSIAGRKDGVSRRGIAKLRIRRARPLPVTAWAPQYPKRTVRLSFNKRKWRTLFLYQPSLQWPMYGVDPAEDAGAGEHQDPAAVPHRLVARAGRADRVPGRRLRGSGVHRQRARPRPRGVDEDGRAASGGRTPAARWPPRPRSSATRSSCTR